MALCCFDCCCCCCAKAYLDVQLFALFGQLRIPLVEPLTVLYKLVVQLVGHLCVEIVIVMMMMMTTMRMTMIVGG
jgi:hypothetical protein